MSSKRTGVASALALLHLGALAAEPAALSESAPPALSEVIVTATPESVAEVDRREPLRSPTADAASLLRNIPGISLIGSGGAASLPSIHGLADDRVRIKVDGMDLISACANHMNPPLSYLDPANIGVLKVFAGITPVSVGGDSIGGSIVAESPLPEFAAPGQGSVVKGQVGGYYRSNNDALGANVSLTHATESVSLNYAGSASRADNYTAGDDFKTSTATGVLGHPLPLDEVGSTAYETLNHAIGVAFKGDDRLLEARIGVQDIPEQLWPNQRMDMLDNDQLRLNLRYLGTQDWGRLEARAWHERVKHLMDFGPDKRYWYGTASGGPAALEALPCGPISPTCAAGMPMLTDSTNSGATLKADVDLSAETVLRVGGELQRYRLDDFWPASGAAMFPDTFWNINDGRRDRAALFAEREAQAGEQWTTLFGVRYERVTSDAGPVSPYSSIEPTGTADAIRFNTRDRKRSDDNVDFTALARYSADSRFDFEVGVARKVRSPSLYERYTWRTRAMEMLMINWFGDGNGYVGNMDLEPEKAHKLSATFDWHAPGREWEFKATPYYTHVADYIDAVRCPVALGGACTTANLTATDRFVYLQFANQSARLYGIDLSGKMPLAQGDWGAFGLQGLLGYTRGENRDTGDNLYNIMPLNARLTLTHARGGWDNAIELHAVSAKDAVSAVRNEVPTAGYALVNLRASHSWQKLRVDFGVDNVFDRFYDQPLGGVYLGQGTTMMASPTPIGVVPMWGTPVPGMGRSLYAGLNYKF